MMTRRIRRERKIPATKKNIYMKGYYAHKHITHSKTPLFFESRICKRELPSGRFGRRKARDFFGCLCVQHRYFCARRKFFLGNRIYIPVQKRIKRKEECIFLPSPISILASYPIVTPLCSPIPPVTFLTVSLFSLSASESFPSLPSQVHI